MKAQIQKLLDADYSVSKIARLLNISGTEVNMLLDPMRYPRVVWADMLRREGYSNERIATILDLKQSSVAEFFGEREKPTARAAPASGFVDVHWIDDKWQASVRMDNGCRVTLGKFDDPVSAAWVRDDFIAENRLKEFCNCPKERRRVPR